jgi:hypothetical protein
MRGFLREQWGRYVPNFVKNTKWNMRRVGVGGFTRDIHRALHGQNSGMRLRMYQRLWYGTNAIDKALIAGAGLGLGYAAADLLSEDEDEQP